MSKAPIRVLIVDDSAVTRQVISERLGRKPGIRVVATAVDPIIAQHKIDRDDPDVIVLDVQMPKMDGISFLKKLNDQGGRPVIIFSGVTSKGSEDAMEALELGALSVVAKPKASMNGVDLKRAVDELEAIIKGAVQAKPQRRAPVKSVYSAERSIVNEQPRAVKANTQGKVIAIGASTGGTEAIREVLLNMPRNCPPIVAVIHMPEGFTASYACRLNQQCAIDVIEARGTERLRSGMCVIAPGNQHLVLKRTANNYMAVCMDGPPVHRHKPSVEVLFRSVAVHAGEHALGMMLTGMGSDGASGMLEMHHAGAYTIAQNEATCVIFGMPREAIRRKAVKAVLPLQDIPQRCINWMNK